MSFFKKLFSKEEKKLELKKGEGEKQKENKGKEMKVKGRERVEEEEVVKVVLVGGQGTGKSALIRRYCFNLFTSLYQPTLGIEIVYSDPFLFHPPNPNFPNQPNLPPRLVRICFWEVPHQEVPPLLFSSSPFLFFSLLPFLFSSCFLFFSFSSSSFLFFFSCFLSSFQKKFFLTPKKS